MADEPAAPAASQPANEEPAAEPAASGATGQPAAPKTTERGWRKRASQANQGLETVANTVSNFQTILTLLGAILGGLAFLNLELGLLAGLNTLFHNLAAFLVRAKVPLLILLAIALLFNGLWLVRARRAAAAANARRPRPLRWLALPVIGALIVGVAVLKPAPYHVAVLTYAPLDAAAPPQDALGTDLATALAQQLQSHSETVKAVLASQADRSAAGLAAVAEEKGVDFVVDGAYALLGPNLRLRANLFDARTGAFVLDEPVELFDLRDNADELQAKTAQKLVAALPLYSGVRAASAYADAANCASAYECYLRGRQYYRWYSQEGYQQAIEAYTQALHHDPAYAPAQAGLTEALTFLAADMTWLSDFNRAQELMLQAGQAMRQAMTLAPDAPETLRAAAFLYLNRDLNDEADALVRRLEAVAPNDAETHWLRGLLAPTAEERLAQFQEAVTLAPNLMIARQFLGDQLRELGRPEEALAHLQAAVQQNPYALRSYNALGWAYLALGRPADAEAQARVALKLEPRYSAARYLLGFALAAQGSTVEAIETLKAAEASSPEQGMVNTLAAYARPSDYAPTIAFLEGLRGQQPDFAYNYNELGNVYRQAGRIDEAIAAYQEALRRDPSLGIAHYNLADLLASETGDTARAETEAAAAIALLPQLAAAHTLHGTILLDLGRFAEAEAALQTAQSLRPQSPWPLVDLANLYLAMGRREEAEAQIAAAQALEPEEVYPLNSWAKLLFEHEDFEGSIRVSRQVLAKDPQNLLALGNLADALLALGSLDEALQTCQPAIQLSPQTAVNAYRVCGEVKLREGDPVAAAEFAQQGLATVPTNAALQLLRGRALNQLGQYEEADAAFAAAAELDRRNPVTLNEWGNALDERGETAAAIEKYEEALRRRPQDPVVLANLADSYRQAGETEKALALVQQALALQPQNAWAHQVWGDLLADRDDYEQALVHYLEANRLEPGQAAYLRDLAHAYAALGRQSEAERAFGEAVEADPQDATTYNDWGVFNYELGRMDEAAAQFEKALALVPTDPVFLANLGDVYWNWEQYEQAVTLYQKSLEADPEYDYALASLGQALLALERPEEAVASLQAAVEIDPDVLWYWTYLARALIATGDLQGAADALGRAAELSPNSDEVQAVQALLEAESQEP